MLKQLKQELIADEDKRLRMYKCSAGKWTIGVGRNIEDRGISEDEAMLMLDNDIKNTIKELSQRVKFFTHLPCQAQKVLANMAFNLGVPRLLLFKKTLRYLEQGNYKAASEEMLDSKWARQVGTRAIRLSNQLAEI